MNAEQINKLILSVEKHHPIPDALEMWAESVRVKEMIEIHHELGGVVGDAMSDDYFRALKFLQQCENRGIEESKKLLVALAMFD